MNKDKFEFHILTQDKNAQGCIELFEKYGFKPLQTPLLC